MNDKEILEAFSEGSAQAFEVIYNRYFGNVFFIARRYLKSDEYAKDARSNTFMKLWQLRNNLEFGNMESLYGWLARTTVHNCIDTLRKYSTKYEKNVDIDYLLDEYEVEDNVKDIFEVSDKEAAIIERLLKRLESLDPKFRIVFKMRCFDELKFIEISQQLHTDLSTVKKRYARAVKLLRLAQCLF